MNEDIQHEPTVYYRARAGEYDEWFRRARRYDRGPEANALWAQEINHVSEALAAFNPMGDVLELVAGTGWWAARLARYAVNLTAVEASPETLAINEKKMGDTSVRYIHTVQTTPSYFLYGSGVPSL